ncbi:DUF1054 domain-containing protein [Paenibacillus sp. HB172176]|uniref:DUF1054 domain-containing protein n=1 Tax=Paenibacillus sp. HB172176 TaxID=2493690 RepID=UPI00143A55DD|nr:DUF1054 domain-containing protein [Paenibacillus sp. HB172176]
MTTQTAEQSTIFTGFLPDDFKVFELEGLTERMTGIQTRIQPKFQQIGAQLAAELSLLSGQEMFLHIARHARRKVNPPKDTWLALSPNKRGYKAHPHFQLGLFDDHLFLWLAFIYELPNKKKIASSFLKHLNETIAVVPGDFLLSMDHMNKEARPVEGMSRKDWKEALTRFRDVGKAELLLGRHIAADDKLLQNGEGLLQLAASTYEALLPLYKQACEQ